MPRTKADSSGDNNNAGCTTREKLAAIFGTFVLISVTAFVAVLILNSVSFANKRAMCREIDGIVETGKSQGHTNSKPSVQDLVLCHSLKCNFDVLECKTPCPFSFELDDKDCPVSCKCAGSGIMEGDIQFDESDVPVMLEEYGYTDKKTEFRARSLARPVWRRHKKRRNQPMTITYHLDNDLTELQLSSWNFAINQLRARTCIQFKQKTNESDYLLVTKTTAPDCTSYVGRKGGKQKIVLGDCFSARHVGHMLMHTLGFRHEHTRHDRDAYIEVKLENVIQRHRKKFRKSRKHRRPYNTEFDKQSVTMFSGFAYSIEEGKKPTILDVDTKQPLIVTDSNDFSENDIMDINHMYCKDVPLASGPAVGTSNDTSGILGRSGMFGGSGLGSGVASFPVPGSFPTPEFRWSDWGNWGHCDSTCGPASRQRYRVCESSTGDSFVDICQGQSVETIPCKDVPCPHSTDLVAKWGTWVDFMDCSQSCGTGIKFRMRQCSNPNLGRGCEGTSLKSEECNTTPCVLGQDNKFDPWTEWSECSVTCGGGTITRYRECMSPDRKRARDCDGAVEDNGIEYQSKVCFVGPCMGDMIGDDWLTNSFQSSSMEEPSWFIRSNNQLPSSICDAGGDSQWVIGDFNGDGKNDVLCRNSDKKVKIVLSGEHNEFNKISWEGDLNSCMKYRLYSGDFDGDKITDVLCVAYDGARTEILIYPVRQGKLGEAIVVGEMCVQKNWVLYVMDANGDGKDDILCRDSTVDPNSFSKIHYNVLEM